MALIDFAATGSWSDGRQTDAPDYDQLVNDGFKVAAALGLNMAESRLTVKPWVLAGRLGYLRSLIDAWSPEKREQALREEYAQVVKPQADSHHEPSGRMLEASGEGNEPDSPPQEPEKRRFRKKRKEPLSERTTIRLAPTDVESLELRAQREGLTVGQLLQRTAKDIADLERSKELT